MLTPLCGIGFILNILSFAVFMDKEFDKTPFFSFLRLYTVNGSVALLLGTSVFTANALSLFTWTTSYPAQFFFLYIVVPIGNINYYFGTMLDLVLTLNRIAIFRKPVKKLFVIGPYKLCAAMLAFCVITDIPYFLLFAPQQYTFSVFNSTKIVQLYYGTQSAFNYSQLGIILTIILECWRDFFLTLVEITLNIWLIFCFKAYLKQRAELLHGRPVLATPLAVAGVSPAARTVEAANNGTGPSTATARNQVKKNTQPAAGTTGQQGEVSSADLRSTIMAIVVCALTIYEHISLSVCVVYPYFDLNQVAIANLSYGALLSEGIKHAANFFIFYFFNKKFAEKLHKMFRC
jgi:hypothetical protein